MLSYSHKIHNSFTELVISGGGIEKIIDTLSNILNKKIIYFDMAFDNTYSSGLDKQTSEEIKAINLEELLNTFIYYPIKIETQIYGYIIVCDEENSLDDYEKISIEHVSTVLKLGVQKKISNLQIETRYRDEFIYDLLLNNIKSLEEIQSRARIYDWNFDKGNIVAIFDIDNYKSQYLNLKNKDHGRTLENTRENIFSFVRKDLKSHFSNAVYTTFNDSIVFIIRPIYKKSEKFEELLRNVSDEIRKEIVHKSNFTISVGIGTYKKSPLDIYLSYSEAKKSIKFGRIISSSNFTVFYEELGLYKLFDSLSNQETRKEFYNSYIGKLIEYDEKNNTNLLKTLDYLVQNDWNLKATADQIYIHYNTMKYRFKRIAEVLGMDLKNSEDKLNIAVALKLLQMVD